MDFVRLVDYVKGWELFEKIDFDQIVSDYDFSQFIVSWFVKIDNINDFSKVERNKKTLFILDKLLVDNISDFFDMSNISILDLNFWMFSYWKKIWVSNLDIFSLIEKWFSVFEPLDLFSFLYSLDLTWNNYIRVGNLDLPENFVWWNYSDIVSLESKWFDNGIISLVSTWQFLPEIVRLWNFLKEKWIQVDILILNNLNLNDVSVLQNNDNFIFVFDFINNKLYENYVKNKLKWNQNINFIYPDYSKLSTVFDDYKFEELEFNVENLANKMVIGK